MAGICLRFCRASFPVKRVKLVRRKDTGGQYSHRPKPKRGGWAGLPDLWPGEDALVQNEKPLSRWCGGPGSVALGGALPAPTGRAAGKSLSSIPFPCRGCLLAPAFAWLFPAVPGVAHPSGCTSLLRPGPHPGTPRAWSSFPCSGLASALFLLCTPGRRLPCRRLIYLFFFLFFDFY